MEQPDVVSSRAGTPAGLAACLPAGRQVDRLRGEHGIDGELLRESAQWRAERIIAEELRTQGWTEADLGQGRKSAAVRLYRWTKGSQERGVGHAKTMLCPLHPRVAGSNDGQARRT